MREHPLVLLIDDEEFFLEIASVKLRGEGFEVVVTHSVPEALAQATELQPDLVLSDIYMAPGPSGWDLALELRRNVKTKDIKVAFFSSLRDPTMELPDSDRGKVLRELEGVSFLSKMDVPMLSVKVKEIINQK